MFISYCLNIDWAILQWLSLSRAICCPFVHCSECSSLVWPELYPAQLRIDRNCLRQTKILKSKFYARTGPIIDHIYKRLILQWTIDCLLVCLQGIICEESVSRSLFIPLIFILSFLQLMRPAKLFNFLPEKRNLTSVHHGCWLPRLKG